MKQLAAAADKVVEKIAPAAKRKKRGAKSGAAFALEESWPKMREESRLLSDIYPYPKNPRTHPPAQLALLAELIKKHGPDQRIVVDEDGVILKGHGRYSAALLAGLHEFPVVVRFDLSEAEKTAMRIQDNAVALLSGWDQELVRGEIGLLKQSGYELSLLGFGETQLVQFMATPGPPESNQQFGEDGDIDYCCPNCSHKWSGNPLAGLEKKKPKKIANAKKAK
jgi:hypothetical protein